VGKGRAGDHLPGDEVNPVLVVKWFYSLYENYKMTPYMCGFDNWHSTGFKNSFVEHFGEGILERINMDFSSLSNPMRLLESALKNKTLIYNNNPIDIWNLRNVSIKMDATGRIMQIKKYGQSKNRIGGALGFVIALAVYSQYKSEFMARGIVVVNYFKGILDRYNQQESYKQFNSILNGGRVIFSAINEDTYFSDFQT